MRSGAKKAANNGSSSATSSGGVRPVYIAGAMGLAWFAMAPSSIPEGASTWSVAALTAAQLFADFVGGWVIVTLVQVGVVAARYMLARTRLRASIEAK